MAQDRQAGTGVGWGRGGEPFPCDPKVYQIIRLRKKWDPKTKRNKTKWLVWYCLTEKSCRCRKADVAEISKAKGRESAAFYVSVVTGHPWRPPPPPRSLPSTTHPSHTAFFSSVLLGNLFSSLLPTVPQTFPSHRMRRMIKPRSLALSHLASYTPLTPRPTSSRRQAPQQISPNTHVKIRSNQELENKVDDEKAAPTIVPILLYRCMCYLSPPVCFDS